MLNYCITVDQLGEEYVHSRVGQEPSGQKYNAMILNPQNKPHNPFINSGAIMVCSLIGKGLEHSARYSHVVKSWQRLCADRPIFFNNTVFLSERNSNETNIALAYLMKSKNVFEDQKIEVDEVVEFYT